ncbi:RNA polymerase sigma factor [Thalassoglobus neptunius]|uniref:RNA polymerase sigma factor n=1 Tax=Thalassoglobus neptunius TaxID=1938619 RepID=A0A5C5X5V9_9PLAN|nr:sigma-70 family RNA polymerase sigma factor [Thalassoglobus neptunius]TWT58320.1 RNA polymerase sigma factor [Thalassoglobus neptunius]
MLSVADDFLPTSEGPEIQEHYLARYAQGKSEKTSGRILAGANYRSMDVESDQFESPTPISEADFVRLFARHELALRNYARLILPDWSSVDDVLQDASITMWESRQRLRDESGFLPWGKVIVRHKCFNAIAKLRRDRLVLDKDVLDLIAREAEAEAASEDLVRIQHSLAECLGELPPERRKLVLSPYRGAGEVKSLAEQSGKTPNSLYKIIGRLRAKLSQCVEEKLRLELP